MTAIKEFQGGSSLSAKVLETWGSREEHEFSTIASGGVTLSNPWFTQARTPVLPSRTTPEWLSVLRDEFTKRVTRVGPGEDPKAIAEDLLRRIAPPGVHFLVEVQPGGVILKETHSRDLAEAELYVVGLTLDDPDEPLVSRAAAQSAILILRELMSQVPRLPIPTIGPGPDGMLGMAWETKAHHLGLEISADGHLEQFHVDLRTRETWMEDHLAVVSPSFVARLQEAFSRS